MIDPKIVLRHWLLIWIMNLSYKVLKELQSYEIVINMMNILCGDTVLPFML